MTTRTVRSPAERLADQIARVRAEADVRSSLTRGEAGRLWSRAVRPQLVRIEIRLLEASQAAAFACHAPETRLEMARALVEVRARWEAIEPLLAEVQTSGAEVLSALGVGRPELGELEARLAGLEGAEERARREAHARRLLSRTEDQIMAFGEDVFGRVAAAFGLSPEP
jgi:hypothetical protein